MVSSTFSFEFASSVSAARLFKASATILQGDGGVASIKHFKFTDALPCSHVNERVAVLDKEYFEMKYTVTEGGDVGTELEFAVCHVKFVPAGNGCCCKAKAEFRLKAGVEYSDEELNEAKEGLRVMYKGVEALLIKDSAAHA